MPDVVIVGGGPAGLAVAIALAQSGCDVCVIEKNLPPQDKACGEGIMPGGLAALQRLGVEIPEDQGRRFRGIRYVDPSGHAMSEAQAPFLEGPGVGIERPVLHGLLVSKASASNVALRWGVRATGLSERGVETDHGEVPGRWIVGADGMNSRVADWAGFRKRRGTQRRIGMRAHFEVRPWTDYVEVHWAKRGEAYVTPVSEERVGVALLGQSPLRPFEEWLGEHPVLVERLHGSRRVTGIRGARPFPCLVDRVVKNRVALVGDAGGYLDAITGEGMTLAFRQAVALAKAIEAGELSAYEREHAHIVRGPTRTTRLLLTIGRHPGLRRRMVRALASAPETFSRILAAHNGTISPLEIGLRHALALGRGFVT